ncbi:Lrp/AsnC family transcriptional regulator [Marinomonas posidonica]|uniref:Lrp/AsnC family transcriptional regulator n=1 Tax=Marinomonas posidonica TaxID=936476 RepID=UPI0037356CF7
MLSSIYLKDSNITVGDVALVKPELSGNKLALLVSVEMERNRKDVYDAFKHVISKTNEVRHCHQITGGYDFIMVVTVLNVQTYKSVVDRLLHI